MEFVSLKTDEEIDTLTIGDEFFSTLSKTRYQITDLTRDHRTNKIVRVSTSIVGLPGQGCNNLSNWDVYRLRSKFRTGSFKKILGKEYDPTQQPYTDDDI